MTRERAPQGTAFVIQNPEQIYEAAVNGVSGELCGEYLREPWQELTIELTANPDQTFDLRAILESEDPKTLESAIAWLAGRAGAVERGGMYVLTGRKGTKLACGLDTESNALLIITGENARHWFDGENPLRRIIKPAPPLTQDAMRRAFRDLTQLVTKVVGRSYGADITTALHEIVISPPERELVEGLGKIALESEVLKQLIGNITIERPRIAFDEIGGQPEAVAEMQSLVFALTNPELYQSWGTEPPKGIIVHGPPGTGKTLAARALAAQADARFLSVSGSDVMSKWVGDSEKLMRAVFEYAGNGDGPAIIFFDEIDAIAPARGNDEHEVTRRSVATMLDCMDGITSAQDIIVIAATNRLDGVDPAILRPGRFDRWIEMPLPTEAGRQEIFRIHMARAEKRAERELFGGVEVAILSAETKGQSGADIAEVLRRVLEEKVRLQGRGEQPGSVTTDDVLRHIRLHERDRRKGRRGSSLSAPLGFQAPRSQSYAATLQPAASRPVL